MATMSMTMTPLISSKSSGFPFNNSNFKVAFWSVVPVSNSLPFCNIQENFPNRLSYVNQPGERGHRNMLKPIYAARKVSFTANPNRGRLKLDNPNIVVESQEEDKMRLRVDLTGEDTQKAIDIFFNALKRAVPDRGNPPPKIGPGRPHKRSMWRNKNKVSYLINNDSWHIFLIKEMISSTVDEFLEKENLAASQIWVAQTHAELSADFRPGTEFGFNVEVDLVKKEAEATSSDS